MKTHSLFCHTKIILETNDDMFPGISSSAFDEPKSKDEKAVQQEEHEWLVSQLDRLENVWGTYRHHQTRLTDELDDADAYDYVGGGANLSPGDVLYSSFDWLDKYPDAAHDMSNRAIKKTSPLFKNIENKVRAYDRYEKQILTIERKTENIREKIRKLEKVRKKKRVAAATGSFGSYAQATPKISTPSAIPKQIPIKNRKPINNPYVKAAAAKKYAGHAAHYPHWSSYWKDQITQLEEILKRNNKGGLDMMYASTHQNGGARFNFVITGANGNLTWRKYDPSPGAGANWMYLDGKKINTSSLLTTNQARQDQLVAAL